MVMPYLGLGLMMVLLDRICMGWWFIGGLVRGREYGKVRRGRVLDPIGQQRETVDGKVWARSGMQVDGRSGRVMGRDSEGLLSSAVPGRGMLVGRMAS